MFRALLISLALFGCSSKQSAPTTPEPAPPAAAGGAAGTCEAISPDKPLSPDQCQCHGGRVNLSRGGEQEHCAAGERELGTIAAGTEGGWCCATPGDDASKAAQ